MNVKKKNPVFGTLGLALVPAGVAILFVGIGGASRGEELMGITLVVLGLAALAGAWRILLDR